MVWIETRGYQAKDKEGNNSFRKLFKYITGRNEQKQNIAMTTPVFMQGSAETKTMAFVMPASMKVDQAPAPSDGEVNVKEVDGGLFAVLSFTGVRSDEMEATQETSLRKWISAQGKQLYSDSVEPIFGYSD